MPNTAFLSEEEIDSNLVVDTNKNKKTSRKFDLEFKAEVLNWYEANDKKSRLFHLEMYP